MSLAAVNTDATGPGVPVGAAKAVPVGLQSGLIKIFT